MAARIGSARPTLQTVRCEVTGDAERGGDVPLASWTAMSTSAPGHPDVVEDHPAPASDSGPSPRRRRRPDPKLALASLAIAFGLVLIGYGLVRSVTGDEVTNLPSAIEAISPVPDAVQVPAQTEVLVDLEASYAGRLTIDGAALETVDISTLTNEGVEPGAQVDVPPGRVGVRPGQRHAPVHAGRGHGDRALRRGQPHGAGHVLADRARPRPRQGLHVDVPRRVTR